MPKYLGISLLALISLGLSCASAKYTLIPDVRYTDSAVYHFESCYVDIEISLPKTDEIKATVQLDNQTTIANAEVSFYRADGQEDAPPLFHTFALRKNTKIKEWPHPLLNEWLLIKVELVGGYAACETRIKLLE